jgi:hypothetical protein
MKKPSKMKVNTFITALLALLLIVLSSCRDKTKPAKNMLVPDNALVEILADTYLGEGIMNTKEVKDMYGKRDSITNYQDIISKYGYTYQQVDSTLKYYFLFKPKKLEKIYDKVTGKLLEMEAAVNTGNNAGSELVNENLWNGKVSYTYPQQSATDPIAFNIPVEKPGLYIFKASYQLYPNDQSIDPRVVIFFSSIDNKGAETQVSWDIYKLVKDGKAHNVELSKMFVPHGETSIKGWLFFQSNSGDDWKKHAIINNISFTLGSKSQLHHK